MPTENVLATQVTLGMIGSGLLQYLKSAKFVPFVNENSGKINHAVLVLTSAAGALGVHTQWNPGSHELTITGLSAASIIAGFWIWAKQYSIQYLVHKGAFGSVSVPGVPPAVPAPPKP